MLLQPGVSSENDLFTAGNPLHFFGAQQSHRNRSAQPTSEQARRAGLCHFVVRSRESAADGLGSPEDGYLLLSSGAPVPDEPRNSFRPSGNVTSLPLALFDPSLAW